MRTPLLVLVALGLALGAAPLAAATPIDVTSPDPGPGCRPSCVQGGPLPDTDALLPPPCKPNC